MNSTIKKCLLVSSKSSIEKGASDPQRLSELLMGASDNLQVSWAALDDLVFEISNDHVGLYDAKNQCPIEAYDVVYFRYWGARPYEGHAIAAARICKLLGVQFLDAEVLRPGSLNKLTQYVNLYEIGVQIPHTLVARSDLLLQRYKAAGFQFPCILKDKDGTRGSNNFLVHSEDETVKIFDENPDITFVMQEFIANSGDYRVIVLGDKVKLVIQRIAQGETHLNNTSKGGSANIVPITDLPDKIIADCIRASQFFGRTIAGVDIVKSDDNGQYYCFEVNRAPQIEHASFEQEKAALVAEYLASF